MAASKIRLALVDDHQIVIDGLQSLLAGLSEFEFVFASTDPTAVPDLLAAHPADILLTDVMMPGMSGAELARIVRQRFPEIRILALSMNGDGDQVNEMVSEADISGYVLKNIGKAELVEALCRIARGGIYFSEEVLKAMEKTDHRKKQYEEAHLTNREIEIVRLIEKEYNNKEIAEALFISERTVETHRKNIFRKTGTNSVIGLIKYAYEHKLIPSRTM